MYEHDNLLSFNTRKALCLQLGENAGRELANALEQLSARLDAMERSKMDILPVVPGDNIILEKIVARRAA
jgi:hypothetical protein